jgi:hypothetical protein
LDAIAQIARRIEEGIGNSQAAVIEGLLDALEARIEGIKTAAERCSYGAVLGNYIGIKISLHHVMKRLDIFGNAYELTNRAQGYERELRTLRFNMYAKVCGKCPACLSRRKPWPPHAKFVDQDERDRIARWFTEDLWRRKPEILTHRTFGRCYVDFESAEPRIIHEQNGVRQEIPVVDASGKILKPERSWFDTLMLDKLR